MAIDCHCPSCGANFTVAEKHAGHRVECPTCAGAIAVPDADGPRELPVAKPIAPPRRRPPVAAAGTPPAEAAEVIVDRDSPGADDAEGGFPNIVVDPQAGSPASRRASRKTERKAARKSRAKTGRPLWLLASFASAAVLAVAVVGVLIYKYGGIGRALEDQERSVLVLKWPAGERKDAAVFIDGRRRKLPRSGPLEYRLEPGPHRVVMLRIGYEQEETLISLKAGQRRGYSPVWKRIDEPPPRSPQGWLHDMEVAKRRAAAEHKDILLALEGSESGEKWKKMREDVFDQGEFRDQMDWRFVLVRIDFPRKDEAQTQVAESYRVSKDSIVVLANAEGRPYAVDGYREADLETCVQRLAYWQNLGESLRGQLLNAEMAKGDQQLTAIKEAVAVLTTALREKMELIRFYEATLNQWLSLVRQHDAENEKGAYEAVFGVSWLRRLADVEEKDVEGIRRVVGELDDWKEKHKFKDSNRGALMHAYAALRLATAEQRSDAEKYLKQAGAYKPDDQSALLMAARVMMARAMAVLRGHGSSGTGFAVAAGGYILTNHHVIEGAGANLVRLPGRKQPVPAKVLADDSQRDIALLKIEVPDGVDLKPLRIAAAEASQGAEIGVYGFPGGEELGKGLKFTRGSVSDEPGQSKENMYLLDCRVNPGNSGGPLCNKRGGVIGMVTLKVGGLGMDSYGMALPAKDLRAFLKKHLPEFEKQEQAPEAGQPRLEWEEISRIVGPSVVMIVKSG